MIKKYIKRVKELSVVTKTAMGIVVFASLMLIAALYIVMHSQKNMIDSILQKNREDTLSLIIAKKDESIRGLRKSLESKVEFMAHISSQSLYNVDAESLQKSLEIFMTSDEILGIKVMDELSGTSFLMMWKVDKKLYSSLGADANKDSFPRVDDFLQKSILHSGKKLGSVILYYSEDEILNSTKELQKKMMNDLNIYENHIIERMDTSRVYQVGATFILLLVLVVMLTIAFNKLEQKISERTKEIEDKNSELKKTLDQLTSMQTQLVESEKMAALGGLVAGVAHEINTPVGIGITAASYMDEKSREFDVMFKENKMKRSDLEKFTETMLQSSTIILSNLNRAADLIQSFKQVAVDQSSEDKRNFKLAGYMHEILLSLRPKLKRTSHHIEVDCNDNIELNNYPGAFSQIMTNLIMNSIIHGFDQKEDGTISIKATESEDKKSIHLIYSDNGKGIPKENLKKIFEPFFTTKRGQGGSGLGLHIIYNIVSQKMGGSISVESEVGTGTTFFINIPKEV